MSKINPIFKQPHFACKRAVIASAVSLLIAQTTTAQVTISEDLTGASAAHSWHVYGGACLTAGNGSGSIPACRSTDSNGQTQIGGFHGVFPDRPGEGALRLTNGGPAPYDPQNRSIGQAGGVISSKAFNAGQGVNILFKTATYGGNSWSGDGMAFMLLDATSGKVPAKLGATGGSLGYSCGSFFPKFESGISRIRNSGGITGGYLAVGIDEYGNFLNWRDNTNSPQFLNPNQVQAPMPNTIGIRGSGSVNWETLLATLPTEYAPYNTPDWQDDRVMNACETAQLINGAPIMDYPYLGHSTLPSGLTIANQRDVSNPRRTAATPITYNVKITQDSKLSVSYQIQGGVRIPVISNQSILANNGPLPSKLYFGFTAATGGATNIHEIMCFKAAPPDASGSSGGVNTGELIQGAQGYFAYYHPINNTGELFARDLFRNSQGLITVAPQSNWNASCVLTGGSACTNTSTPAQSPNQRNMFTWNGSKGVPFQSNQLNATQSAALTHSGDSLSAAIRLAYLRGDRSNEIPDSGISSSGKTMRKRDSILGDIMNSSPTWVGAPKFSYVRDKWVDLLTQQTGSETNYKTFQTTLQTRTHVVYIGSNDGFLHGFRAGSFDSSGAYVGGANNDGKEVLAYIPDAALKIIHNPDEKLDIFSPLYAHNSFVDAAPGMGDLFYNGAWHTWLVGGLGAGGNAKGVIGDTSTESLGGAIYALDITNMGMNGNISLSESSTDANKLVVGEWSKNTLNCVNVASCARHLGSTYGTPIIRRMHNGNWAVIFGNGLNSTSGTAGIFIMTVDQSTGSKQFYFFDTGVGASGSKKNGIVEVTAAQLDDDHIADYIYAGDVLGNVWRFDVTSNSTSNWTNKTLIFKTSSTPGEKPISTAIAVSYLKEGPLMDRIMLNFGTGQMLQANLTSEAQVASSATQSIFGIWDPYMSDWNAKGSKQFAVTASPPSVISSSNLQTFNVTDSNATDSSSTFSSNGINGYRMISNNSPVCWKELKLCAGSNDHYGWKLDLPQPSEQIIANPTLSESGYVLLNTKIPADNLPLSCTVAGDGGFTMSLPISGNLTQSLLKTSYGNNPPNYVAGVAIGGVGSPGEITDSSGKKSIFTNTTDAKGNSVGANETTLSGSRSNWLKLR